MLSNMSKPSAPVAKSFLHGFVEHAEMSFHYLEFHLLYFRFHKRIHLFASILNAEHHVAKRLLLVKSGGEVTVVALCHTVVKFGE